MPQLVIHALPASAGTLALTSLPGKDGGYDSDLRVISEWRPDLVVSMTTKAEMAQTGAQSFGEHVESELCPWIHLPIIDFGAPPSDIAARWPEVSAIARRVLAEGGKVLVHCRGGCGRSGMVVLRLMVECGEDPDAALTRLRNLRPCAVETEDQMRWAMAGKR